MQDIKVTLKKRSYDIAMKGIKPQLVQLRDKLEQQSERLEREFYTLQKKLSDRNLSLKLTILTPV